MKHLPTDPAVLRFCRLERDYHIANARSGVLAGAATFARSEASQARYWNRAVVRELRGVVLS